MKNETTIDDLIESFKKSSKRDYLDSKFSNESMFGNYVLFIY